MVQYFLQGNNPSTDEDTNYLKQYPNQVGHQASLVRGATFTKSMCFTESRVYSRNQTPPGSGFPKTHTQIQTDFKLGITARRRPPPQVNHGCSMVSYIIYIFYYHVKLKF